MGHKKTKPIENIKKICAELGDIFEKLDEESEKVESDDFNKNKQFSEKTIQIFSKLKEQLTDLS